MVTCALTSLSTVDDVEAVGLRRPRAPPSSGAPSTPEHAVPMIPASSPVEMIGQRLAFCAQPRTGCSSVASPCAAKSASACLGPSKVDQHIFSHPSWYFINSQKNLPGRFDYQAQCDSGPAPCVVFRKRRPPLPSVIPSMGLQLFRWLKVLI
jgi:hypothetical protein